MQRIPVDYLRDQLDDMLTRVANGEEFSLTRDGERFADLLPRSPRRTFVPLGGIARLVRQHTVWMRVSSVTFSR